MVNIIESYRIPLFLIYLKLLRINFKDNNSLLRIVELASRGSGIVENLRSIPYSLRKYKLFLPIDLQIKHSITMQNLWDRINGKPREELFDLVLEVAAFARQNFIEIN